LLPPANLLQKKLIKITNAIILHLFENLESVLALTDKKMSAKSEAPFAPGGEIFIRRRISAEEINLKLSNGCNFSRRGKTHRQPVFIV